MLEHLGLPLVLAFDVDLLVVILRLPGGVGTRADTDIRLVHHAPAVRHVFVVYVAPLHEGF